MVFCVLCCWDALFVFGVAAARIEAKFLEGDATKQKSVKKSALTEERGFSERRLW